MSNQQLFRSEALPALPLDDWRATKETLHRYTQVVGKIRLALQPKVNHWWHVTLYVSSRGLTTHPIAYGSRNFELAFDFIDHQVILTSSDGTHMQFPLHDRLSVADFYRHLFEGLATLDINVRIWPMCYDLQPRLPFADDTQHASYDQAAVTRFWRILVAVNNILETFRGRFLGKSTPVHFFWHSFDLVVTRFSGRAAPIPEGMGRVDREAYSHEVISFGFWPGDATTPAPAFYAYVWPEPDGLGTEALQPAQAHWIESRGNSMAILSYDAMRQSPAPEQAALEFLESAYQAGAKRAGWDVAAFALNPPM